MKKILLPILILLSFFAKAQYPITMQFQGPIPGISNIDSIGYTYTGGFPGIRYLYNAKKTRQVIQSYVTTTYLNPRQFINAGDVLHPISLKDSIPTQTGNAGKVLGTDGTSLAWVTGGGGGGGTTTNPLSLTYGFTGQPLSFNGSAAITGKIDTSLLQTVLNFFPKGDTRYVKTSSIITYTASNGVIKTGSNFTSDTSYNRTVANSLSLAQLQTKFNGYLLSATAASTYALQTTTISPGYGMTGGGSLGANRTLSGDSTVFKSKVGFLTDYNNLSARITTNTSNIATNTTNIATNTTAITTKEGLLTLTASKTANYTLSAYDYAIGDVTSGTFTFTLPNAPADGTLVGVKMVGQTGTNAISLAVQGVDVFNGGGTTASLVQNFQAITFKYKLSNHTWYSTSTNLALGQLDLRYAPFGGGATTIYTGDGTLTSNRLLTNGGFNLRVSDSLAVATPTFRSTPGAGTIVFWGNSIDFGQGVSGSGVKYTTQVASYLGLTENNQGLSGSAVEHRTPFNLPANTDYITREPNVPTYASVTGPVKILVIDCGPNDFNANSANYNPTNYITDLTSFINYCTGTAGWPAANILLIGNTYVNPTMYTGGLQTSTIYQAFITGSQTVATNLGIAYVNPWDWFNRHGGVINMADALHPNNMGHTLLAQLVEATLSTNASYRAANAFKFMNYSGANGLVSNLKQNYVTQNAEFSNIKLNNKFLGAQSNSTRVLGLDSLNNISPINFLPTGTLLYSPELIGNLTDYSPVTVNYTLATYDWGLLPKKIYTQSTSVGGLYSTFQLLDGNGSLNFTNTLTTGANLPIAVFSNATGFGLQIYQNTINVGGNIVIPFGSSGVTSSNNSYGGLIPFDGGLRTILYSKYSTGVIQFDVSQGVNNASYVAQQIAPSGAVQFFEGGASTAGTVNDNGIGIDNFGTARFQLGSGFGVLGVVSMNAPTQSGAGGTLVAATYYGKVFGVDAFGNQTNQVAEVNVATTGTTSSVTYTWTALTNATSYRVYIGTSSNGENKYLATTGTSITDIGTGYTTAAMPTQNKTYLGNISSTGVGTFTSTITKNFLSAINATATATAAQIAGGTITSTSAATTTITLPTATLLATQLVASQGTTFEFTIDNTAGANTVTIALGAGMTQLAVITGANTLTIPSGATGIGVFRLCFSSATACTLSRIE